MLEYVEYSQCPVTVREAFRLFNATAWLFPKFLIAGDCVFIRPN